MIISRQSSIGRIRKGQYIDPQNSQPVENVYQPHNVRILDATPPYRRISWVKTLFNARHATVNRGPGATGVPDMPIRLPHDGKGVTFVHSLQ